MTGGQMAPTSLPGQVTQTSPYGRDPKACGYPVKICEMLAQLEGPEYLERVTVNSVAHVRAAKKAIKKAFPCRKVAQVVLGLEVAHAHIHLIPMQSEADADFRREKLKLSEEEFKTIASKIQAAFE